MNYKRFISFCFIVIAVLLIQNCFIATTMFAQFTVIPVERRDNYVVEPLGPGEINWTTQVIKAKGWGIIDTTISKPKAKLMATRAATVVAQRNLLEIIKGVRVVSETKVQDLMIKSDYVYTRLEGVVKGAKMIGDPVEKEGIIEVELAIGIYDSDGIAPPIHKGLEVVERKLVSLTEEEKKEIEEITGLVIDATNTDIKPAVFPRILDENGNVLFDPAEYYDPNDPTFQKLIRVLLFAEQIKETEFGKNPYIIKALRAINSDIVVSNEEVKKVNWLQRTFETLLKIGKALLVIM